MRPSPTLSLSGATKGSERRSHLDVDDNDPTVGQKFSTETLRRGDAGRGPIPSSLHGAPETAEESREVLARLKRMAGFESQDFDPGVRSPGPPPPQPP